MNRRTLKKHCRRAKAELIRRGDSRAADFTVSQGEETVSAPIGMERRFVENGFLFPGPLKGTPLIWRQTSYEYDGWECNLASEYLATIKSYENFEPTADDLAA